MTNQTIIGISIPVAVTEGGTGAITAAAAATSLGVVQKAGDTMTGALVLSGDPTASNDASNKNYVDGFQLGFNPHNSCAAASTVNLNATYSNGTSGVGATLTNAGTQAAFVIDGYTAAANDRILIKDQTAQLQNGIYVVTNIGSVSTNWVLTRAPDYDNHDIRNVSFGDFTLVILGTQAGKLFFQTTPNPIVLGTTAIVFSM